MDEAYRLACTAMDGIDRHALVAALGGLALAPENAVLQVPLEALVHVAVSADNVGDRAPTRAELRAIAACGQALIQAPAPDPPEQPFAVPVVFGTAQACLPLGTITAIDHHLRLMLEVVERLESAVPGIRPILDLIEAVLRVSDLVSERAGLVGVVPPGSHRTAVSIPTRERFDALARSVSLSSADLRDIAGIGWAATLQPLIASVDPGGIDFDGSDGTLSYHPFLPVPDGLVLAVPGMIVASLLRQVVLELTRIDPDAASAMYRAVLWADVARSLRRMDIEPVDVGGVVTDRDDNRTFLVDAEHLLVVTLAAPDPFMPDKSADGHQGVRAAYATALSSGRDNIALVLVHMPPNEPSFFGLERPPDGVTQLLMTPADLSAMALVNLGQPTAVLEYAEASSRIREDVNVWAYSALDEYAVYRKNQDSYYLSDDRRPTALFVAVGSALELRLQVALRGAVRLATTPTEGPPAVVMRRYDDSTRGIWAPATMAGQPARVVAVSPSFDVWIVGRPYATMQDGEGDVWHSVLDTVSYWVWELTPHLVPSLYVGTDYARPWTIIVSGPEGWAVGGRPLDPEPVAWRVRPESRVILLRLGAPFAEIARGPDNTADRLLVRTILEAIEAIGAPSSIHIDDIVDLVAPLGLKKMLILLDVTSANTDLGPHDVPRARGVRDAQVSFVLDELGSALRSDGHEPAPAGASDARRSLLQRAVELLTRSLEAEVAEFELGLLETLLTRHEAVARERADLAFHLPARLACFPEDEPDLFKRETGSTEASVALRFLIEYVAARPPSGRRVPSLVAVDRLVAIAHHLISCGHAADVEFYGLADTAARILDSGRLGINTSAYRQAAEGYAPSYAMQHVADMTEAFGDRWGTANDAAVSMDRFDEAARAEWGYSMTDIARVVGGAVAVSLDENSPVVALELNEATTRIEKAAEIRPDVVERIVANMSLSMRPSFVDPPAPYRGVDVYPWRYNRRLSHLRRPFTIRDARGERQLVYGRRGVYQAAGYLVSLIRSSRLWATSREMKALMGDLSRARGADFNERVALEVEGLLGVSARRGVKKIDGVRLDHLGDVDVLAADPVSHTIWAIECKSLVFRPTPYELSTELQELEGTGTHPGMIEKHMRRSTWLADNLSRVVRELRLQPARWDVQGAFVVDDDLLGPYLRPTAIPVWTVPKLLAEIIAHRGG